MKKYLCIMLFLFAATIIFIGIYTPKKHDIYKKEIYKMPVKSIEILTEKLDFILPLKTE